MYIIYIFIYYILYIYIYIYIFQLVTLIFLSMARFHGKTSCKIKHMLVRLF